MNIAVSQPVGRGFFSTPPQKDQTEVWLAGGQSRMIGFATGSVPTDSRVLAWEDSTSSIVAATEPLEHNPPIAGKVGWMTRWASRRAEATGRRVLIVPCARSGSNFQEPLNFWDAPSGDGYVEAVSRFNSAFAEAVSDGLNPIAGGVFWANGEGDAGNTDYYLELDNAFSYFRTDLTGFTSTTPIIISALNSGFVVSNVRESVAKIVKDTPNRVANTALISEVGVSNIPSDPTHEDFEGQETVARRATYAVATARANTSPIGTQLKPLIWHSTISFAQSSGDVTLSVAFGPVWYDPKPTTQSMVFFRADDANRTNEEIWHEDSVSVDTVTQSHTLPAPDGKFYYGAFKGTSANGEEMYFATNGVYQGAITMYENV